MWPEAKSRMRRQPAVMLAATLIAIAVSNFVIATIPRSLGSYETISSLALGLGFSQMALAAVWSALASSPASRRTLQATILVALVWLSHSAFYGRLGIGLIGGLMCGVYWTIWLATQLPLLLLRRRIGLVLMSPDQGDVDVNSDDRVQFGIRGLLIVTAIVAIGMAFGRYLAIENSLSAELDSLDAIAFWRQLAWFYLVTSICQVLAAVPLILAVLVPHVIVRWMGLAGLWFLLIMCVETYLFGWLVAAGRMRVSPLVWTHGTQFITLALVLLLMRQVGLRAVPTQWVSAFNESDDFA